MKFECLIDGYKQVNTIGIAIGDLKDYRFIYVKKQSAVIKWIEASHTFILAE